MRTAETRLLSVPMAVLAVAVLAEMVLLRTGTRTLIHIPGLGRFEDPIAILAEVGRLSFYLAVVAVIVTLAMLAFTSLRRGGVRGVAAGAAVWAFLGIAVAGRAGVLSEFAVGWSGMAVLVVVTAASWRGTRMLPVGLFVLGSVAAGWSVFGQGRGGGLSVREVDGLLIAAEILVVLSAMTAPLLLEGPMRRGAALAGIGAAVLTAGAFAAGSSTVSILVLWNLGVPGWLPGIAYALAFGSLVATAVSALVSGSPQISIGLVLLLAGGVGAISTYQTGLVLAAVLVLSQGGWPRAGGRRVVLRRHPDPDSVEYTTTRGGAVW